MSKQRDPRDDHPIYLDTIQTGNCVDLIHMIPTESVDMVFTDPPYLREYLWAYEWLSRESMRVLRPGGYVFAYAGAEFVPEIVDALRSGGLTYFWQDVLMHNGGFPRMWHKKLLSGYKPVFCFTKGEPAVKKWRSTLHTSNMDKQYHRWGQGHDFPIKMIELLTHPSAVVLDPFCGGGTTPAVCKMLGRHYIAFEQDKEQASIARERVYSAQVPLFTMQAEQADLWAGLWVGHDEGAQDHE